MSLTSLVLLIILSQPGFGSTVSERENESEIRLILFMVIDQARRDYMVRYRPLFEHGLEDLLDSGISFSEARVSHALTRTAPGHAALVTGLHPSRSGIVGNQWYDRTRRKVVYAVGDAESSILPPRRPFSESDRRGHPGRSPRNLEGTSISDWIKKQSPHSKAYSLGGKDRTSILAGGKNPHGVFWYDPGQGAWVTSRYYTKDYPRWARRYNDRHHGPAAFNESLMIDFAKTLIDKERLGSGPHLDFLSLTFCTVDLVGHMTGPDSPLLLETLLGIDRAIGDLLRKVDKKIGREHVVIVVASDHGVMPLPESVRETGVSAGYFTQDDLNCFAAAEEALDEKWGEEEWLPFEFYLNSEVIERKELDASVVESELARGLEKCRVVKKAWTRTELEATPAGESGSPYHEMYIHSFHAERSPDVIVQFREYYTNQVGVTATHGSPYRYDTDVPLIIVHPGLSAATVTEHIYNVDLAPTLAGLLGIAAPPNLDGVDRSQLLLSAPAK